MSILKSEKIKAPQYFNLLIVIWALLLVVTVALTLTTATKTQNRNYDIQLKASQLTEDAIKLIKDKKIELNLPSPEEDKYNSGIIGPKRTRIQTTEGDPSAKRTSVNPNFAAVYIEMFKQAGLKANDQIAIITSGSFPALNISATIAAQEYGLKSCIMTGIGASSFGATDPEFTYFDMAQYLYENNIFKKKLDYVSFGGGFDDGSEFPQEVRNQIYSRIQDSGVTFLSESDFEKNIKQRTELIYKKCPNVKLLLNVGGSLVSMGSGYTQAVKFRGLVKPNYLKLASSTPLKYKGLMETFLEKGVYVIQMLNITKIAYEYGLPQDPIGIPSVGSGDVYFEKEYRIDIPIIGLVISIGLLSFYFINRKKYKF